MAAKKTQTYLQIGALLHWATRASDPSAGKDMPIKAKFLKVTATTIEEASAVSLVSELLQGTAPKTLQEAFDKTSAKNLEAFKKQNPDFKFVVGGRPRKVKGETSKTETKNKKAKTK